MRKQKNRDGEGMFCPNCGREVSEGSAFCPYCGAQMSNVQYSAPITKRENVLALIGFILSFFVAIAGLICSIIAYKNYKEDNSIGGKNFAIAGIAISAATLGLALLIIIIWVPLVGCTAASIVGSV